MSKARDPGAIERGRARILISGPSGNGKSYGLCGFPHSLYIDPENGASEPQFQRQLKGGACKYLGIKEGSQDQATVLAELQEVGRNGNKKLNTVIMDSLSKLFNDQIATEYDRMVSGGRDMSATFGAEKKPAIGFVRRLIRFADMSDNNLILVCHQKDKWAKNEIIGQTFDGWDKLEYEFHLWLRIERRKAIIEKSRYEEFPKGESFDWNYEEFAKRYGKTVLEKDAVPVELATSGQIVELNGFIRVLKIGDDVTGKWLEKAKAESFAELSKEQIGKCLAWCKAEIAKVSPEIAEIPKVAETNGSKTEKSANDKKAANAEKVSV